METDRVRFYSTDDETYSSWSWTLHYAYGDGASSITLPFIFLIDEDGKVVSATTGPQSVANLCESGFGIANPGATTVDVRGFVSTEEGMRLLALVNEARAAVGVAPLVWDADLAQTAIQRVSETAVYYSHTRPNGTQCFTAWPSWAYSAAENIAAGYDTYEDVNQGWTNSSGHYANMIDGDMVSFAAAMFVGDDGACYWVECFSGETGPNGMGTTIARDVTTTMAIDTALARLTIGWSSFSMTFGYAQQLPEPTLGDANLADPTFVWSSSDPSVATVSDGGLVRGVGVGTATITYSLAGNPKVTGSVTAKVNPRTITYADVYLESSQYAYTGLPITPQMTVAYNGDVLVEGVDYEVSCSNNVEVGTATVTITGIGNYKDVTSKTFRVDQPFCDVFPKTATSNGTSHYEDILWLYQTGISKGWGSYPNRVFRGTNGVQRGDMAAFLFRLAVLAGVADPDWQPSETDMAYFTDVNPKTPHAREIWWLASVGVSKGWTDKSTGEHAFRPSNTVVRQDMAAFLFRLACLKDPTLKGWQPSDADVAYFSDVSESTPHANEIWWLASTGVSRGWTDRVTGEHTFCGGNTVIRQDMAAFLHRMHDEVLAKAAG